jgi:hypothetical protein
VLSNQRCLIFGLCLTVPFAVGKELAAPAQMPVDGVVALGPAPRELPTAVHTYAYADSDIRVQVDAVGSVLFDTPRARYHVTAGCAVAIDAPPDIAPDALRYMVLHYCVPALLNQRGCFALHANAIHTLRGAVVLAGQSGGGKSTLHAALLAQGMAMLSDDVAVLRTSDAVVEVLPGLPRYRMTADALTRVQPPAERSRPLAGPRHKVALWAPPASFHAAPAPLAAIYVLEPYPGDEIIVERIAGCGAFRLLQVQAYPPLESMALPAHLRTFGALVDRADVYHIRRPAGRWTVDELVDIVLRANPLTYAPAHG